MLEEYCSEKEDKSDAIAPFRQSIGKNVCAMKWSRKYVKTDMKIALSTNDLRASLIDGRDSWVKFQFLTVTVNGDSL